MSAILTLTMNPSIDVSISTDKVIPVRKIRCTDLQRDPGGGGINVARVVKRLGGDCCALHPIGGLQGRLLHRLIDAEGIMSIAVQIAAETRESFNVREESSGNQYRFILAGPELRATEWQACLDRLASLAHAPLYVVASGSLPPGVPIDFYARVARTARGLGARMALDTSGPALAAALEENIYLVKPNLRELKDMVGRPLDCEAEWEATAAELVNSGKVEVVALTLGEKGALLLSHDTCFRAPGIQMKIASAIGAGDSFLAAMVWRLSLGAPLDEAFRYAVAAGTAALLTPGTDLCRSDDVERLYSRVRFDKS